MLWLAALLMSIGTVVYGAESYILYEEVPDGYGYWLITAATILQIIIASTMLYYRMHCKNSKHCTGQTNAAFTEEHSATQSSMQHFHHPYSAQVIGLSTVTDGHVIVQEADVNEAESRNMQNFDADCWVPSGPISYGTQGPILTQGLAGYHNTAPSHLAANAQPPSRPSVPQSRYATPEINPVRGGPMQPLSGPGSVLPASDIHHTHPVPHSLQSGVAPSNPGVDHIPVHQSTQHEVHAGNHSRQVHGCEDPFEILCASA